MAVTETFTHRGESWMRIPADPVDRFCVGVDLGQSSDPTAIAVVRHRVEPLEGEWIRERATVPNRYHILRQKIDERFEVPHLERVPLGTSYPAIVNHVTDILGRAPVRGADLVIDQTGCGAPVGDLFEHAGLDPVRIVIAAGIEPVRHGHRKWSVPKTELISNLDALLHTGMLKIAAELREAPALGEELKNFRRHVSEAGRNTYGARVGAHDDLVLSLALACWWLRRGRGKGGEFGVFTYNPYSGVVTPLK
jgi:hypothetical protein